MNFLGAVGRTKTNLDVLTLRWQNLSQIHLTKPELWTKSCHHIGLLHLRPKFASTPRCKNNISWTEPYSRSIVSTSHCWTGPFDRKFRQDKEESVAPLSGMPRANPKHQHISKRNWRTDIAKLAPPVQTGMGCEALPSNVPTNSKAKTIAKQTENCQIIKCSKLHS